MGREAAIRRRKDASHSSFLRHRGYKWLKVALVISVAALVGYFLHDPVGRPNGGSWYGYTLGTIGAVLIVWLTLLGIRKRNISPGNWSLKGWTSAHVYLGLSLIVVATLHTGFQLGWNVHTLAYFAMMLVIATGLWGIFLYATIPAKMGRNREEMTIEEMVQDLNAMDRQLTTLSQPLSAEMAGVVSRSIEKTKISGGLFSRLRKHHRADATDRALDQLRKALITADGPDREVLSKVVNVLERKQNALDRARQHVRYRSMLELWLYLHVPLTFLLLAALFAHIFSVFFYW